MEHPVLKNLCWGTEREQGQGPQEEGGTGAPVGSAMWGQIPCVCSIMELRRPDSMPVLPLLCEFGTLHSCLWASVSLSMKWGNNPFLMLQGL